MFVEMMFKFSNPCSHEEKTRDEVCIARNVQRKFPAGCSVKNIFWRRIPPHYNTIQVAYAVSYSRLRLHMFIAGSFSTPMPCQNSCYLILLILSSSVWQFVIAIFVIFRSSLAVTSLSVFVAISHLA